MTNNVCWRLTGSHVLYSTMIVCLVLISQKDEAYALDLLRCDTGLRNIEGFTSDELNVDEFEPKCVKIAPELKIRDPEFSHDFKYVTWQESPKINNESVTEPGAVWIAPVSSEGDFLTDTASVFHINPAPAVWGGNGPEFGLTLDQNGIETPVVYATILRTDENTGRIRLRMVRIVKEGPDWTVSSLPDSNRKGYPFATFEPNQIAKLYFYRFGGEFPNFYKQGTMWREDNDDPMDVIVYRIRRNYPSAAGVGRWVPGTDEIFFQGVVRNQAGQQILQIASFDTASNKTKVLFKDDLYRRNRFPWRAPELRDNPAGDLAFLVLVENTDGNTLVVYKQSFLPNGDVGWEIWTEIDTIDGAYPYMWSPEAFVNEAEERSYILLESLQDRPLSKGAPSLIWLARLPKEGETDVLAWSIGQEPQPELGISHKNDPEILITAHGEISAVYIDRGVPIQ